MPEAKKMIAKTGVEVIKHFIGRNQMMVVKEMLKGEEKTFFADKIAELAKTISEMPKSYETDGQGNKAIVHLHYFKNSCDWYIIEKDMGSPDDIETGVQLQAYGFANLGDPQNAELGYISIQELIEHNVELDFHFAPCTLEEVKQKMN